MPHTRKKQKRLTKVNGGSDIPKSFRRRELKNAVQTILDYSFGLRKPTNLQNITKSLLILVKYGLIPYSTYLVYSKYTEYTESEKQREQQNIEVSRIGLQLIQEQQQEQKLIQSVLNKMVSVWSSFDAVKKGDEINVNSGSWYEIYDMIPSDVTVYPEWGTPTGEAAAFIEWLLQLPKLNGIIQCVYSIKGVSKNTYPEYTKFASIVNSKKHHFCTYLYPSNKPNKYVHFDAAGHNDADQSSPHIKTCALDEETNLPPNLPCVYINLLIHKDSSDFINQTPECPPKHLNNYKNACAINSVWYALMGFPKLREYCYEGVPPSQPRSRRRSLRRRSSRR